MQYVVQVVFVDFCVGGGVQVFGEFFFMVQCGEDVDGDYVVFVVGQFVLVLDGVLGVFGYEVLEVGFEGVFFICEGVVYEFGIYYGVVFFQVLFKYFLWWYFL